MDIHPITFTAGDGRTGDLRSFCIKLPGAVWAILCGTFLFVKRRMDSNIEWQHMWMQAWYISTSNSSWSTTKLGNQQLRFYYLLKFQTIRQLVQRITYFSLLQGCVRCYYHTDGHSLLQLNIGTSILNIENLYPHLINLKGFAFLGGLGKKNSRALWKLDILQPCSRTSLILHVGNI